MYGHHQSWSSDDSRSSSSSSSSSESESRCEGRCAILEQLPPDAVPLYPPRSGCGPSPYPPCPPHGPPGGRCPPGYPGYPGYPPQIPAQKILGLFSPLMDIKTPYSNNAPNVELTWTRKNGAVTMTWEPFTGAIGQNGVDMLTFNQSLGSLPPYPMVFPISVGYNSKWSLTTARLDPGAKAPLTFYLNAERSGTDVKMGDTVHFPGGSMTWWTPY